MSKTIKVPMGTITVSTLPDEMRVGDVYRCARSRVAERVGQEFTVKDKGTAEYLDFLDSYGDQFVRVATGDGNKIILY